MMEISLKRALLIASLVITSAAAWCQDEEEEGSEDCGGNYGPTAQDSVECVTNLSLYSEFYRQDNFKEAIKYWRKCVKVCPQSRKSLYLNGVKMYKEFEKNAPDQATKDKYVDSIAWVYDLRIQYCNQEGYVRGRKGNDLLRYRKDTNPKQAFDELKKAFELGGDKTEAGAILAYYQAFYFMYKKKQATKQELIELFPGLLKAIETNVKNAPDENTKKGYLKAKEGLETIFSAVAGCEDLVKLYAPKFQANPNDTVLAETIVGFMLRQKCTDEKLFETATEALIKGQKNPSASSMMALGKIKTKNDKCGEAVDWFRKCAEKAEDNGTKLEAYMNAAKCYYNIGQFANCKAYAQRALGVDPKHGEAYILIGDAYAKGGDCEKDVCIDKSGYWAAVDKYEQARSVDASVASKAASRIASAEANYPKKEDCFFKGLNEGTSFTIGCWINETTTVRVRQQ